MVPIDTYKGQQHTPEFRAVNPNAKTPAIVDTEGFGKGPVTVFDSNAILLYLAEKTGKFLGPAEARGELLPWLMFVASGLGPYSGQSVHFRRAAPEQIPYAQNRYLREAERHYRVLDERPAGRNYIVGGEYTIVDIAAWAGLIGRVSYWGMNGVTSLPPRARALSIIQRHLNLFLSGIHFNLALSRRPSTALITDNSTRIERVLRRDPASLSLWPMFPRAAR